jgi:glycosyltransferase involved in cell wall biosynthesis
MRVLHLIETLGQGGAEQALVNLVPGMRRAGIQAEVAVLAPPFTLEAALSAADVPVHRLGMSSVGALWQLPVAASRLWALASSSGYDILHAHLLLPEILLAGLPRHVARSRRLVTFHNIGYDGWPPTTLRKRARVAAHRLLARRRFDRWTAVSAAAADSYRRHLGLELVDVIPLPFVYDTRPSVPVDRARVLQEAGVDPEGFVLVQAGRLSEEKGHEYTLEALGLIAGHPRKPHLLIVGSGGKAAALQRLVDETGLKKRVTFRPGMANPDLIRVFRAADCLVMSSLSEGFPLVLLEAMGSGLPVVASAVGGIPDMLDQGRAGRLYPVRNANAMAERLRSAMEDHQETARLRARALEIVEQRYSISAVTERWREVYQSSLRGA